MWVHACKNNFSKSGGHVPGLKIQGYDIYCYYFISCTICMSQGATFGSDLSNYAMSSERDRQTDRNCIWLK